MKRILTFSFLLLTFFTSSAYDKDSVVYYPLPDSVKAVSFMAEFIVRDIAKKKYAAVGIMTDAVILNLKKFSIGASINFQAIKNYLQKPVAKGLNVKDANLKSE